MMDNPPDHPKAVARARVADARVALDLWAVRYCTGVKVQFTAERRDGTVARWSEETSIVTFDPDRVLAVVVVASSAATALSLAAQWVAF